LECETQTGTLKIHFSHVSIFKSEFEEIKGFISFFPVLDHIPMIPIHAYINILNLISYKVYAFRVAVLP